MQRKYLCNLCHSQ